MHVFFAVESFETGQRGSLANPGNPSEILNSDYLNVVSNFVFFLGL